MGCTDLRQERSHMIGIHLPTSHPVQLCLNGADCPVNVDKLALVAVAHHGSRRAGCPTATNPYHAHQSAPRLGTSAAPVRPRTSSGLIRAASVCGSFFPTPLVPADHSLGAWCLAPPCASHDAPAFDTPAKPQQDAPVFAPTQRAMAQPPASALWPTPAPKAPRSGSPPVASTMPYGDLPGLVVSRAAQHIADAVALAVVAPLPALRTTPTPSAPATHPEAPATTPPTRGRTPEGRPP